MGSDGLDETGYQACVNFLEQTGSQNVVPVVGALDAGMRTQSPQVMVLYDDKEMLEQWYSGLID